MRIGRKTSRVSGSKGHIRNLAGFATVTLRILANDANWSADTLDEIARAAQGWTLADTNDDGEFEIINYL